jgi:hypothetical protein
VKWNALEALNVTRVLVRDDRLEAPGFAFAGQPKGLCLGEQRFHVR